MLHVKIGGETKNVNKAKNVNGTQIGGTFINFVEIEGGKFVNFVTIWGICIMA